MEISPPKRIYQYDILDLIGRGPNGAVWKGRDSSRDITVAVKLLRPDVSGDREFQARCLPLLKEARGLSHAHLATLYEVIDHEDQVLLVSELVAGRTVAEILAASPIPPREFLEIAEQVARGLGHLHTNGFVHGSIHPSNIIVAPDGRARLTDFGLPRRLEDSHQEVSGFRPGTARYASPEEAQEERPTPASDLFSLGAVFCEMLGGRPPFPGESVDELLRQILSSRPDYALLSRYHVPGELILLLRRLMGVKAEERCTQCLELIATLEAARTLQRDLSGRDESDTQVGSPRFYLLISLLAVLMVLLWSILADHL